MHVSDSVITVRYYCTHVLKWVKLPDDLRLKLPTGSWCVYTRYWWKDEHILSWHKISTCTGLNTYNIHTCTIEKGPKRVQRKKFRKSPTCPKRAPKLRSGLYPELLTSQKHFGGFRQVYDLETTAVGSAAIWRGLTSPGAKAKSWWRLRSIPKTPACNIDKLSESGDMMMTLLLVHWVSHIDMTCTPEVCIHQQHARNSHGCCIMGEAAWWFWVRHHVDTGPCKLNASCLWYFPVPLIVHGTDAAHQDMSPWLQPHAWRLPCKYGAWQSNLADGLWNTPS